MCKVNESTKIKKNLIVQLYLSKWKLYFFNRKFMLFQPLDWSKVYFKIPKDYSLSIQKKCIFLSEISIKKLHGYKIQSSWNLKYKRSSQLIFTFQSSLKLDPFWLNKKYYTQTEMFKSLLLCYKWSGIDFWKEVYLLNQPSEISF